MLMNIFELIIGITQARARVERLLALTRAHLVVVYAVGRWHGSVLLIACGRCH